MVINAKRNWVLVAGMAAVVVVAVTLLWSVRSGSSVRAQPSQTMPQFYYTPTDSARDEAKATVSDAAGFAAVDATAEVAELQLALIGFVGGSEGPGESGSRIVYEYYQNGSELSDDTIMAYQGFRIRVEQFFETELLLSDHVDRLPDIRPGASLRYEFDPRVGSDAGGQYYVEDASRTFIITVWTTDRPPSGAPTTAELQPLFQSLVQE